MEKIIEILIYLSILSIITEKIVGFIRRYPKQFQIISLPIAIYLSIVSIYSFTHSYYWPYLILILIFLSVAIVNVAVLLNAAGLKLNSRLLDLTNFLNPYKNVNTDKANINRSTKEKEITLLSMTVGTSIAFIFNANFFIFFNSNLADLSPFDINKLFQDWFLFNPELKFHFSSLVGILTTGLFLGFGSKFFYELLEMLFQIRNLRRKQKEESTYKVASLEELKETLSLKQEDIVEIVFNREKKKVFDIEGVNGISISIINWNGENVKGIKITTEKPALIQKENFKYKMPSETDYQVPVSVIRSNVAQACSGGSFSAKISNENMTSYGTLCVSVMDDTGKTYFLSCFHVVKHKYHNWYNFRTGSNIEVVFHETDNILGEIYDTRFNDYMDAALITNNSQLKDSQIINRIGRTRINSVREVIQNDVNSLDIKMSGATTKEVKAGKIVGLKSTQKISYPGLSNPVEMNDLIELKDDSYDNPLVKKGDSGALIYTKKGEALGMVIATDDVQSYAIPLIRILKEFNVELYKDS